jgi:hypothetical protein
MGADADKRPGKIVVELPVGRLWCKLRTAVFAWTNARFTFPGHRDSMRVRRDPIVTVIGRAFYGIDHSVKNPKRSRWNYDSSLAAWEIHPVMKLVQNGP